MVSTSSLVPSTNRTVEPSIRSTAAFTVMSPWSILLNSSSEIVNADEKMRWSGSGIPYDDSGPRMMRSSSSMNRRCCSNGIRAHHFAEAISSMGMPIICFGTT
jgi:hypothetical protein